MKKKDGKFVTLDFKYPLCHSLGGADNGCCEYKAMKISPSLTSKCSAGVNQGS